MTKFEITDAMLDAAEQAYDTIAAIEHDAWCYTAPTRAAISAAIEASGILEENARLRAWIENLANNPRKPATWMQTREAAADFLEALNKEPTL